jgi:hypothetical protein
LILVVWLVFETDADREVTPGAGDPEVTFCVDESGRRLR